MSEEDRIESIKQLFRRFKHGRFEVESVLGSGGMGLVVCARDTHLRVMRAIKIFNPELNHNSELLTRFKNEAAIMAGIDHTNIVRVFDTEEFEQHHFMILEWVDGGSLEGYLKKHGAMPPRLALQIIYRVCDALMVAHKQNVVHRDIKPANILITTEGVPKVTDFGIAHMDDPEKKRLTATNQGAGSPGYMAPEQMSELANTDARADVYATAVTFWSLMTKLKPPGALFFHDIEDSPELLENVPVCLHPILKKAVARKPEHRYQSIAEFVSAVRSIEHLLSDAEIPYLPVIVDDDANTTDPTMTGVTKFASLIPKKSLLRETAAYHPSGEGKEVVAEQKKQSKKFPVFPFVIGLIAVGMSVIAFIFYGSTHKPISQPLDIEQQTDVIAYLDVSETHDVVAMLSPDAVLAKDVSSVDADVFVEQDVVIEKPLAKKELKVSKLPKSVDVKAGETLVIKPKHLEEDPPKPKPEIAKVGVRLELLGEDKARVWLVGQGGKHKFPGNAPPGIYKVIVIFEDQDTETTVLKNVEVKEGSIIRIRCSSQTEICQKL